MVKITSPLMSMSASGKIGERLVFSQRKSGQQARFQKAQKYKETPKRIASQSDYTKAVSLWNKLTQIQKDVFKERAKNLKITGYNLFVKENILMVEDLFYLYVGGATTNTVRKYLKSDLSYIGETANYGGVIRSISQDSLYLYVGGATTNTVRKYLKSDLSYIGQTSSYGDIIYSISQDSLYLYVGGAITQKVKRYLLSDLSFVSETANYGGTIYAILDN